MSSYFFGLVMCVLTVVALVRRRRAIGGWLFCYFASVFVGDLVSAWTLISGQAWRGPDHDPMVYWVTTGPGYMIGIAVAVTAFGLIRKMDETWLARVRTAETASLVSIVFAGCITAATSKHVWPWVFVAAYESIVLTYLYRSKRIKRVFITKDWPDPNNPSYLDPAPQKRIVYTPSELEAIRTRQQENP